MPTVPRLQDVSLLSATSPEERLLKLVEWISSASKSDVQVRKAMGLIHEWGRQPLDKQEALRLTQLSGVPFDEEALLGPDAVTTMLSVLYSRAIEILASPKFITRLHNWNLDGDKLYQAVLSEIGTPEKPGFFGRGYLTRLVVDARLRALRDPSYDQELHVNTEQLLAAGPRLAVNRITYENGDQGHNGGKPDVTGETAYWTGIQTTTIEVEAGGGCTIFDGSQIDGACVVFAAVVVVVALVLWFGG